MASRGKYLVQLSLQKKHQELATVCHTKDDTWGKPIEINRKFDENKTISEHLDDENCRESTSSHFRIQGKTVVNTTHIDLECNESDGLSDSFSDEDLDSVSDPIWKPEKSDLHESDSDCTLEKNKNSKKSKHKKNIEKEYVTDINNNPKDKEIAIKEGRTNTAKQKQPYTYDLTDIELQDIEAVDHEEIIESDEKDQKGKKRNRKAEPTTWERNINKRLRMEGKEYKSVKRDASKTYNVVNKNARSLLPRNCSKRCEKRSKGRMCTQFTEKDRDEIFEGFWKNMDWDSKRVFVIGLVDCRNCDAKEGGRRGSTYLYHLKKEGVKLPVCKNMFLSTLAIGEKSVYGWMEQSSQNSGTPGKVRILSRGIKTKEIRESAEKFLDVIPKMPSHYCRTSTSKVYVEPTFTSFSELYKVYSDHCSTHYTRCASRKVFSDVFREKNMSLFKPKKDQCDLCCSFETGNATEAEYNEHIKMKEEARVEKNKDKELAMTDDEVKVITVDLQAVLLAPFVQASAMYYKTKLACHNYTIYDLSTKDVFLYFWHEGEGDLSASSFASCLTDFINNVPEKIKELVIFSDGCTYQNRNVVLANALLKLSIERNIVVTQKYLTKGHTQMECDSVHSTIETKKRGKPIYSPHNYVELMREARPTHKYTVKYLTHEFFSDYKKLTTYSSIRPGVKPGDPVVTDICCLKYVSDGRILYKLRFPEEYRELHKKSTRQTVQTENQIQLPRLHASPIPIKSSKFNHLQELKSVIPADYHGFYDTLPHN